MVRGADSGRASIEGMLTKADLKAHLATLTADELLELGLARGFRGVITIDRPGHYRLDLDFAMRDTSGRRGGVRLQYLQPITPAGKLGGR